MTTDDGIEALRRMWESGVAMELSNWEEEFVASIIDKIDGGQSFFSEKQMDIIDRIIDQNGEHRRRHV